MSILETLASKAFPEGNLQNIKTNAPNQMSYNIDATRDLVQNQPFNPFAPGLAATTSLPYDMSQGIGRAFKGFEPQTGIMDYDDIPDAPTFADIGRSIASENPIDSLLGRTYGATLGLGDKLTGYAQGLSSLFGSNAMADQSITGPQNLGFIEEAPQVKGMSYEQMVDLGLMGPDQDVGMTAADLQNRRSKFQGFKNQIGDFINNPVTRGLGTAFNFATGSLPGMVMSGIGSLFSRNPNAPSYQSRSPNINYRGLNTNNLNDFYDSNPKSSTFGTTRFDRATPGSFASFRTLADYFNRDKGNDGGNNNDVGGTGTAAAADTSQGQTGYGSCFIAGTKVTMADGTLKNIEEIIVGDKVKGHKENNEVIKLDPTLLGDRKLYSFNNNDHYFFTSEHPFMTEEGWKSIKPEKTKERDGIELYNQLKGELKIGDKLVTDKGLIEITDIKSKEINKPNMPLYNFNVSNDNSYIADGYVVHNKGGSGGGSTGGGGCFDPKTPILMADGSTKEIKNIQLGDDTKGGEVTAVIQFKALDEIHDYKGVTVSGSHFVKEDGKFIMVKDSPLAVKIDKIPVVYTLDTSERRIFIKDIEFADYNGDGVAKNFLNNAGVDLTGFDKEVLRQVEHRLI